MTVTALHQFIIPAMTSFLCCAQVAQKFIDHMFASIPPPIEHDPCDGPTFVPVHRSAIQYLCTLLNGTATSATQSRVLRILARAAARFDEALIDIWQLGPVFPPKEPRGTPYSHWWWWIDDTPYWRPTDLRSAQRRCAPQLPLPTNHIVLL